MPSTFDDSSVMIVAAEASSALYGQRILESWKRKNKKISAFGIGNRAMEELGFERIGRSEELAVVGITEVLKHYSKIRSVFYKLIEEVSLRKPKFILLLDYPDFNLRLAKKLKPLGVPIIYYISPQVWAWRKSRIELIKKYVDHMLVLLPFEKDFYAQHGVHVDFVGHPLLDEINPDLLEESARQTQRLKYGIGPNDFMIGLMPGSRHSELKHHLSLQLEVAELMIQKNPRLKFALLAAPTFSFDELRGYLPSGQVAIQIIREEPLKMVALTDAILCASGTATLVVGLMKRPMVVMYRMNSISALLAKLFVRNLPHFGLINLVLGKRVVPELFQESASAQNLSQEMLRFADSTSYYKDIQNQLGQTEHVLGEKGATERVVGILEKYLI